MIHRRSRSILVSALTVLFLLGACSETRYVPFDEGNPVEPNAVRPDRIVEYDLKEELLSQPATCVMILPIESQGRSPELIAILEEALTRHLSLRVSRIINGALRDDQAAYHGIPMIDAKAGRQLATMMKCDAVLEAKLVNVEGMYLMFYASYQIGLELRLIRTADGTSPWRARHIANRSVGGMPLGPGIVTSAYLAADMSRDEDTVHSLADELTRRLFTTWPARRNGGR